MQVNSNVMKIQLLKKSMNLLYFILKLKVNIKQLHFNHKFRDYLYLDLNKI